jgi:uncharacterized protein YPO0396
MPNKDLNLSAAGTPDGPPGFRLERLELWNWGTFHGEAQVLEPRGGWALLVGDNGSGKSTAVDALRTLLVPPRILNYNDASGDGRRTGGRDRTRRSYIRGAWASSSTIDSTSPSTQYLRDPGTLSGIAAVFTDAHRKISATLAQILWEHEDQVRELYGVSRGCRSLRDLVAGHANTADIKRAARRDNWEIEESFTAYAERMRSLLHIPGDKALEVFNRAIGMKEVSDIDAFVRQFMLPSADTFAFIRDTVQPHYRTLLDCWSAIDRAERQIVLLRPVAQYAERISSSESRIDAWKHLQELVRPYFATRHLALLRTHAVELGGALASSEAARGDAASRLSQVRGERDDVNAAINATDVGPRLQAIERELKYAEDARKRAQQRRDRIEPAAQLLKAASALNDASTFVSHRRDWEECEHAESVTASEADEARAARRHQQELALAERGEKIAELESVERNRVNIPRDFLAVRLRISQAIGVAPDAMPFAGELMEVRSAYAEWTGAIERLLRAFGLSLLVPEVLYRPAAGFINSTTLGLRLTFHRVPAHGVMSPNLSNDRVPGRLDFRTDHPLHLWVASELVRRFNHRCCNSIAELEAIDRGLTREGLTRDGTRHIKDDARPVDDPSTRILGWTTDRKIAALRQQIVAAEARAATEAQAASEAARTASMARDRANAARELLGIPDFAEIDPHRWSEQLIRLKSEQTLLERTSEELRALRERLRDIDIAIEAGENELRQIDGELGRLHDRIDVCRGLAEERQNQLSAFPKYEHDMAEAGFGELNASLPPLTLENAEQLAHSASQTLQGKISYEQGRVNDVSDKMIAGMSEFLGQFPDFRQILAVGRTYAESFAAALHRIEQEDLPRHRERFEYYLNENLVGDLLMLNRRLEEHQEAIETRIDEINAALCGIDYSEETYVQLRLVNRPGQEVAEFRRSLRGCFEHGISPAPEQRLQIFERVRNMLEQFQRDPEGTQRVTDVRTWFAAGVRELRRTDESEANYYAATTGKSGGQKAKLAFTILASALSAQYGLSTAPGDAANFRLVVIDEAFSRTDEPNSTRAMQLFSRLGFQLLIVGPFDAKAKLAVPFVQTIHLASNPVGDSSRLVALTREQVEATKFEEEESSGQEGVSSAVARPAALGTQ